MFEGIRDMYGLLKKERFFKILGITGIIIIYGALAIFFADRYYLTKGTAGFFDAVYWAVVTIATVGYGDIVPVSKIGKIFAMTIILSGAGVLSLVTATIASIFVERRIREGKGLETVREKDHIIICGWNENGEKIIDSILIQFAGNPPSIVLVNELERDEVQSIQYKYKDYGLFFVRGNFVKEDVLARANLVRARAAIVLADTSGGHSIENADERTIFGTMAIKSKASKVRTCAELTRPENKEHLIRANVDEVVVRGETAGFLLASAAVAPGVADSLRLLISNKDENKLWRVKIPPKFGERTFGELSAHMRNRHGALVFAVVREKERVKLEDILSHDSTFIDEFIRRKFEESGKDFFGGKRDTSVVVNPPDDYVLGTNDWLVVLSKERPAEAGFIDRLVGGTP
jgi:voltage-gated potassium channel